MTNLAHESDFLHNRPYLLPSPASSLRSQPSGISKPGGNPDAAQDAKSEPKSLRTAESSKMPVSQLSPSRGPPTNTKASNVDASTNHHD
eukprot:CAMPEP_0184501796 /NCGR_PEP_ID=MMETSP0113_2-20130426/48604_1 /TAXON_ID=91329 /ORGANISM="Norrisiella sphaerica, Strain BC52" /LENGTH=88 /DNA_ID=CAMNT_0026890689 /DNA_START=93 /DNA_END=359 /DNA_ORIENTATION=-